MKNFTDSEMRHIAAGALKNWYGFGPKENAVTIDYFEYDGIQVEITCNIGCIQYIINGRRIGDGSVCINRNALNVERKC